MSNTDTVDATEEAPAAAAEEAAAAAESFYRQHKSDTIIDEHCNTFLFRSSTLPQHKKSICIQLCVEFHVVAIPVLFAPPAHSHEGPSTGSSPRPYPHHLRTREGNNRYNRYTIKQHIMSQNRLILKCVVVHLSQMTI